MNEEGVYLITMDMSSLSEEYVKKSKPIGYLTDLTDFNTDLIAACIRKNLGNVSYLSINRVTENIIDGACKSNDAYYNLRFTRRFTARIAPWVKEVEPERHDDDDDEYQEVYFDEYFCCSSCHKLKVVHAGMPRIHGWWHAYTKGGCLVQCGKYKQITKGVYEAYLAEERRHAKTGALPYVADTYATVHEKILKARRPDRTNNDTCPYFMCVRCNTVEIRLDELCVFSNTPCLVCESQNLQRMTWETYATWRIMHTNEPVTHLGYSIPQTGIFEPWLDECVLVFNTELDAYAVINDRYVLNGIDNKVIVCRDACPPDGWMPLYVMFPFCKMETGVYAYLKIPTL